MNFCTNCGNKLDEGSKFCANCGNGVTQGNNILEQDNHNNTSRRINKSYIIVASIILITLIGSYGVFALYGANVNKTKENQSKRTENKVASVIEEHDNLDISVDQVDTSEYPRVKLYLRITDKNTDDSVQGLDQKFFYISEKLSKNSDYIKANIKKVAQLNEKESLNINMVADVSGSMNGQPLSNVKSIMANFLNSVQFDIGDEVELTAFSDGVYTLVDFTKDRQSLINEVKGLRTGDMTSLYDALYAAVNKTAIQNGAKCVIAFTDGMDNNSNCTAEDVLTVANRYNIPIFIIGIGDNIGESELEYIASNTKGYYVNISDINDMGNIYTKIYKQNKELYVLEYETTEPKNTLDDRDVKISLQTGKLGGEYEYNYEPHILLAANKELSGLDDIDTVVGKYLNGFVKAINNNNFSYLENYVVPGPLRDEVEPYIQNDIKERLVSYEIVKKEFPDNNTCIVGVHDTYEVQNYEEPLHMRTLDSEYVLTKQSDGSWKFYAFNRRIKILSKIRS